MSIPHLITFKPAGRFYFGTSQSFGEGFYAVSSRFPSQTTILGALRATLLEQKGLLDLSTRTPKKEMMEEVHKLTGKAEMKSIDDTETDNDFGKIIKVSPVFIVLQKEESTCADDLLFPVPEDVFLADDELKVLEFQKEDDSKVFSRKQEHFSYLSKRRIKEHHAEYLGGIQFWNEYKAKKHLAFHKANLTDEIIVHDSQPGNARKDRKIREEEKLFYTKKDYRLAKNYSFGVIIHFSEESVLKDWDVILGGERSLFKMKVKKLPMTLNHVFTDHPIISRFIDEKSEGDYNGKQDVSFNDNEKLVLISPFVANESSLQDLEFAIIDKMNSPRSLGSRKSKSDSVRVIPAGSVLFPGAQLKKVNTYPIPVKIGYNFAIKF